MSVLVASIEVAKRRTFSNILGKVSGPLSDTPVGTTATTAQMEKQVSLLQGKDEIKRRYTCLGWGTRGFLDWIRGQDCGPDEEQVPHACAGTAEGFWATTGALSYLGEGTTVSFHIFSLPEDRCVRPLLKNLGKHMPKHEIRASWRT